MAEAEVFVDDVVEMIILNLPLKSVLKFRCVSKRWDYRISDKRFSQKHYNIARCRKTVSRRLIITSSSSRMEFLDLQAKSSSFRKLTCPFLKLKKRRSHDQVVKLLGSSSGLVCLSLDPHKNFYLWNPSTSFFRKLPDPDFTGYFLEEEEEDVNLCVYHYGFGCVSAADENYKLLIGFRNNSDFEEFFIFSWKDQIWRDISNVPQWICFITQGQGSLSNEKLHWPYDHRNWLYGPKQEDCILAFDLENEKFGKLSLPKFDDDGHLEYANLLGVSCEGLLHLVHHVKEFSGMKTASIWFLKEHGVTASWTRLFNLKTSPEPLEPITCLGPIFVIEEDPAYYWKTFTEIRYQNQPQPHVYFLKHKKLLDMIVCEETLVRLDDADEEEASSVGSGDESDD
ncbi:PREDICTED: F-box/kelch-repeat protein At3g23880-like [Fragaria vesca subsp. vesca]|uniref:F-box/kelch-repeat protein At3g23880-like n=1 Tax=Fragaria vesca subsp. vesca TaxID=101020 RepID=UPI0002C32B77|nr:PREDICTED: F-box/kelch-repeat protein At3g23880-like [Fragaria vesca subsp. vesca]